MSSVSGFAGSGVVGGKAWEVRQNNRRATFLTCRPQYRSDEHAAWKVRSPARCCVAKEPERRRRRDVNAQQKGPGNAATVHEFSDATISLMTGPSNRPLGASSKKLGPQRDAASREAPTATRSAASPPSEGFTSASSIGSMWCCCAQPPFSEPRNDR